MSTLTDQSDRGVAAPAAWPPDHCRVAGAVVLTKHEAFAACELLAAGERVLVGAGRSDDARPLGLLFDLIEDRLMQRDRSMAPVPAAGYSPSGSNCKASELMQ